MKGFGSILYGEGLGGWSYIGKSASEMPQTLASGFAAAAQKLAAGSSYEALYVVAEQMANGTNYLVISRQTMIAKTIEKFIKPVIVNIPAGDVTGEKATMRVLDPQKLPDAPNKAFNAVMQGWTGSKYEPVLFAGANCTKGMNYHIICSTNSKNYSEPVAKELVINTFQNVSEIVEINSLD